MFYLSRIVDYTQNYCHLCTLRIILQRDRLENNIKIVFRYLKEIKYEEVSYELPGEEVTMVTLKARINIWLTDLQEPSGIFSYNINIDKGIMTPHWCLLRYPVTSRFLPWKTNNFQ